ncbi:phosphoribosylpyrophosphate synthetase [Pedobacter jamesrossensis]|uniref:Phosphoribosylpyrophosphate synthetase n=1 Tax=Pedobacter jamesrossensis TaxID=1908238 RepID=A0ABV8NLL7_9SPHI
MVLYLKRINGLKKEGYTVDFNIDAAHLVNDQVNSVLSSDDFKIDKVFRFEGASNPDDESVLYAISSAKFGTKGVLVNGYGISSEARYNQLLSKLNTHPINLPEVNNRE